MAIDMKAFERRFEETQKQLNQARAAMPRLAFSGHRDCLADPDDLFLLAKSHKNHLWVHGGARGFDQQVEAVARKHGIPTKVYRPDYERYGKAAPLRRNDLIIEGAVLLVACWDYRTTGGTFYTMHEAHKRNIPIVWLAAYPIAPPLPVP